MRFQFDIELHSIQLAVPYTCKLQIVWKKGKYFSLVSIIFYSYFILNRPKATGIEEHANHRRWRIGKYRIVRQRKVVDDLRPVQGPEDRKADRKVVPARHQAAQGREIEKLRHRVPQPGQLH